MNAKRNPLQRHLDAIRAGVVTKTTVIGLRKALAADYRRAYGYTTSSVAPTASPAQIDECLEALRTLRPRVDAELHASGLALFASKRYRKQARSVLGEALDTGIVDFRLVGFDEPFSGRFVPVYEVTAGSGHRAVYRCIPWQSGGSGPEPLSWGDWAA